MTEALAPAVPKKPHNKLLVLIAVYKALQAILIAAVGVGALRLMHKDLGGIFDSIREALHFSPESRLVNFLADKVSLVNDPMLRRIGVIAFSYSALSAAEGIGLFLEKAWGEVLTLLITASFLPWEIFEVHRQVTWLRVGLLIINVLVVVYLLKVVEERSKRAMHRKSA
jgi:uncharacterized membrane protein (DUF2068 family)